MLKYQLQSHAHKKHTAAHKHFLRTHARTHTLPVNRSSASLVEVHVVQLYVPCLDLFNVGLSSMKPCRPLSQTQRTVPNQTMGGVGWGGGGRLFIVQLAPFG